MKDPKERPTASEIIRSDVVIDFLIKRYLKGLTISINMENERKQNELLLKEKEEIIRKEKREKEKALKEKEEIIKEKERVLKEKEEIIRKERIEKEKALKEKERLIKEMDEIKKKGVVGEGDVDERVLFIRNVKAEKNMDIMVFGPRVSFNGKYTIGLDVEMKGIMFMYDMILLIIKYYIIYLFLFREIKFITKVGPEGCDIFYFFNI
jgi:hypothetical protein